MMKQRFFIGIALLISSLMLATIAPVSAAEQVSGNAKVDDFTEQEFAAAERVVEIVEKSRERLRAIEPERFQTEAEQRTLDELDATNPDTLTPEQALLVDARDAASQFGTSILNAVEQKRIEAEIGYVLDGRGASLEQHAAFAGIVYEWVEAGPPRGIIRFTEIPERGAGRSPVWQVLDELDQIEGVEIAGGAKYSVGEVAVAKTQMSASLEVEKLRTYSLSFNLTTDRFEVVAEAPPAEAAALKQRALARMSDAALRPPKAEDWDFSLIDEPVAVAAKGYGGMKWNYDTDNYSVNGKSRCTSAFTVRKTGSSTEGMTSAAHCENLVKLNDSYNGNWYDTYFQGEYLGAKGDFEWRTTTADDLPKFYNGSGLTTVTWRVSNSQLSQGGHWVKRYGRASGTCTGWVADTSHDQRAWVPWTGTTVWMTDVVRVANCFGQGGDSGGPIFSGSTAYGVYHGYHRRQVGSQTVVDAVFSKAQNVESYLGVYIQFG